MQPIRFKKTDPRAQAPRYATAGAACFDLASIDGGYILPDLAANFGTGLAFEIPDGHVMLVFSRSGHGFKNGVRLSNSTGVVDSDYRGSVAVKLHNDGNTPFRVEPGDRIAQALVLPVAQIAFIEADELTATERGAGGFGSTGTS